MPLFSAVLNLFRAGETSSADEEDGARQDCASPSSKAYTSASKSPRLLQKLNRMQGNSVILETNRRKRSREFSPDDDVSGDDDDQENVPNSQKRRRVCQSTTDDVEISKPAPPINVTSSTLEKIQSPHMATVTEKKHIGKAVNSFPTERRNAGDNVSGNKSCEYDDDIPLNEKDVATSMSDLIKNTYSKESKDNEMERCEVKMDTHVLSLDENDMNICGRTPVTSTETQMDEVSSKPGTTSEQPEETECVTTFVNDNQPTSSAALDTCSTSVDENQKTQCVMLDNCNVSRNENQVTSNAIMDNSATSRYENQATSRVVLDNCGPSEDEKTETSSETMDNGSSEDEQQATSSTVSDNGKSDTKNVEDSDDNQLVPDVGAQHVTKPDDETSQTIKDCSNKERKKANGAQVVADENNNEQSGSNMCNTDEDEEKLQEQLIAKQISEGVLTDSMLDQEKKLHEENLQEENEIVTKAMEEWETTVEKQRYSRLQHLLQKSNVYSTFLLQRIEEQKVENEKKKLREAKKAEKLTKEDDNESPQTVPETKHKRNTKGKQSGYNITDYVDTEALKKSSEESIAIPSVPDKDDNKGFSIGHHSKETDTSQSDVGGYQRPKLFTGGSLRDYQIEGVEWMKVLFENGVNGILADEMGLGKTIQCIALIAHLIEKGVRGPFLVTAPLSTLPNWLSEFKRFTPDICAVIYHGKPEERMKLRRKFSRLQGDTVKSFPVAITSYEIIMRDRKHLVKYMWKYLIVDEGHRIKNLNCKLIRELKAFPTANRLLLTGTPLQNNLSELWSLLNFLLPDIFNDLNSFQAWFDFSAISESDGREKIIAQEREHHVLERLHAILTPFLLRRLKSDVSIDIPRKKEVFVYAPLTQKQKYWYQLLLDNTRLMKTLKPDEETTPSYTPSGRHRRRCSRPTDYSVFDNNSVSYEDLAKTMAEEDERKRDEEAQKNVSTPVTCERNVKTLNILMMLRKTCNHPYLLEYPLDPVTQDYRIDEEVITSCGKTLVLDQMLAELKRRGHKVLLFSFMTKLLDILEDFCYLRKYKFSRIDGSMDFETRQAQIADFTSDPDVFIFLLSTRAGGLGLNLTAADTVILYDSDWNPQQDLQAQDRCHRIGQTKPVVVYRLLTANTVDQRIVERATEKRRLEKMIIHREKFKGRRDEKQLSAKELVELLQSSDHVAAINSDDVTNTQVLSTEQLNKLLDRSDLLSGSTTVSENTVEDEKLFKVVGIAE